MTINNDVTDYSAAAVGRVAAVGMFDGLHIGHRFLLDILHGKGRETGLRPLVVTFSNHPLEIIAPEKAPRLLSTPREKAALLHEAGTEACIMPFNDDLRGTSATEFLQRLARHYGVRHMLLGFNNRFGHDAPRDFDAYRALALECGIGITKAPEYELDGELRVSSSIIRDILSNEGDVEKAAQLLGKQYSITGIIAHGKHLGRTIGFPTANLTPNAARKLIPRCGVYAATAVLPGKSVFPAVVNIGHCPTIDCKSPLTIEAHLIGFSGDIYNECITLNFHSRLRDERRFPSLKELCAQIDADRSNALALLE